MTSLTCGIAHMWHYMCGNDSYVTALICHVTHSCVASVSSYVDTCAMWLRRDSTHTWHFSCVTSYAAMTHMWQHSYVALPICDIINGTNSCVTSLALLLCDIIYGNNSYVTALICGFTHGWHHIRQWLICDSTHMCQYPKVTSLPHYSYVTSLALLICDIICGKDSYVTAPICGSTHIWHH